MMNRNQRFVSLCLIALVAMAGLFVAGTADASNMGFKKTFTYTRDIPASNEHWVSLPYLYDPRGQMGVGENICNVASIDAEDLAYDLNGGVNTDNISFISSKSLTTGFIDQYTVGGYCDFSFLLDSGRGYQIAVTPGSGSFSMTVVGSHNNAASIPFDVDANASKEFWVSVPYHFKRPGDDTCTNVNLNASDISNSFPVDRVDFVSQLNETTGFADQYTVGGYCDFSFNLVIGQGYQVTLNGTGSVNWAPSHF